MQMAYDPGKATPAIAVVDYQVNATGDAWFPVTIASTDSPDYAADKAEAVTQCGKLSPLGQESVA